MNKVAIVTIYYPAAELYIKSAYLSMLSQTVDEFDWVIINVGGSMSVLKDFFNNEITLHILDMKDIPPLQNRVLTIEWCRNAGYQYIIFLDPDDWMSELRVEALLDKLAKYSIIFSDLAIVSEDGKILANSIWMNRFEEMPEINAKFIQDKNCIGLGNAAINLEKIGPLKTASTQTIATDWYYFFQVLQDTTAIFSPTPVYYRQHANNLAGIKVLTRESIAHCIKVKMSHYRALLPFYPELRYDVEAVMTFDKEIYSNEIKLKEYIQKFENINFNSLWWEEINYNYA